MNLDTRADESGLMESLPGSPNIYGNKSRRTTPIHTRTGLRVHALLSTLPYHEDFGSQPDGYARPNVSHTTRLPGD